MTNFYAVSLNVPFLPNLSIINTNSPQTNGSNSLTKPGGKFYNFSKPTLSMTNPTLTKVKMKLKLKKCPKAACL